MTYRGTKPKGQRLLLVGGMLMLASVIGYLLAPFATQKFAAFPGLFALFLLFLGLSHRFTPLVGTIVRWVLWIGFIAGISLFLVLEAVILSNAHDKIKGDPQVVIVLGAQVKDTGPSVLLRDRLNRAVAYWEEHPDVTIVVTGGQGPDEPTTEAYAMAEYLVEQGVPASQIIKEEEAHNTHENITLTMAMLTELGYDMTADMAVISNGFHLTRTRMLWHRVTGTTENLTTLAAPCSHTGARVQSYLREAPALIKSWIFDR